MTFYGNVRYKLLNGFSNLNVQEQVWELNSNGQPINVDGTFSVYDSFGNEITVGINPRRKLDLTFEFKNSRNEESSILLKSGKAESNYLNNTVYCGIISPEGKIDNLSNFGITPQIIFKHDINLDYRTKQTNIQNKTIELKSSYNNLNNQHVFYMENAQDPSIVDPFSFNSLLFTNSLFIDKQGHIGNYQYVKSQDNQIVESKKYYIYINNKYTLVDLINLQNENPKNNNWYELQEKPIENCIYQTIIEPADQTYLNDYKVNALVGGINNKNYTEQEIKDKTQYLKSINSTVVKLSNGNLYLNANNEYEVRLSNCADLYTTIGKTYNLLQNTSNQDENFYTNFEQDYLELNELINGNILLTHKAMSPTLVSVNLYQHNIGYINYSTINNMVVNQSYITDEFFYSMNFLDNSLFDSFDKNNLLPNVLKSINYLEDYSVDRQNSSLFLQTIEDIRQYYKNTKTLVNTVFTQKFNEILDFYNLMNIVFHNYNSFENTQKEIFKNLEKYNQHLNPDTEDYIWFPKENSLNVPEDSLFIKWVKRMRYIYNIQKKS